MRKQYDPSLRFQTIESAARSTGLSQYFLRRSVRDGSCPHIKSGSTYLINVPLLIEQLNEKSLATIHK